MTDKLPIRFNIALEELLKFKEYETRHMTGFLYLERYIQLQERYIGLVQSRIREGEMPETWGSFIQRSDK